MKTILFACFIAFGFTSLYAQGTIPDTIICTNPDVKAQFSGDIDKYLSRNIKYAKDAEGLKAKGTVYVAFVIEKDGSVSNIKVLKGIRNAKMLDSEAVKVVSAMPRWKPAMDKGNPVRVKYMIPIYFSGDPSCTPPQFPYDLDDWISKQINYPTEAVQQKIEGDIYINFSVEKDGSISHINVAKSVKNGALLAQEAKRIVSIMPNWTPGYQYGVLARVDITIRVPFRLKTANTK